MESKNTNKHRLGTLQDPETIRMAKHIPFWPETVAVKQLAQDCGFSINGVESRMASCHTDFLIFNDGSLYSRLKPDLSNLQEVVMIIKAIVAIVIFACITLVVDAGQMSDKDRESLGLGPKGQGK